MFRELSGVVRPGAILATNTSYLNINDIASAATHPDRVIGLHFFSPANVMRLLEIVPGRATSASVLESSSALGEKLGKVWVVAGNYPGFIGNRMLRVYRREAQLLLEEGATRQQVDAALEEWGMAMGPFAAQDLSGIDIAMSSRHVFAALDVPGGRTPRVIEKLFEAGRLGQKTKAGWYRYDDQGRRQPDAVVDALVASAANEKRPIAPAEIVERTIYPLINEGANILEQGYALSASDIDLVYLHGYGFPASRGGPMCYADRVGLNVILRRIAEFRSAFDPDWEPAPLLRQLADAGKSLAAWEAGATVIRPQDFA